MDADLFHQCDFAYIGKPDGNHINGSKTAAEKHGLPYTLYDRQSFMTKYPQTYLRENEVALVDHSAGIVYPVQNIKTFLEHAEKHGAKILENSRVMSWTENENGVRIVLKDGTIVEADQIVITAGAYTNQLVPAELGSKLKVTRQLQIWIEPEKNPAACSFDQLKLGFMIENEGREIYGIPTMPGHGPAGIKFGNVGDYGYGAMAEVKNADYYKDYTDEEIDNLRKEAEVVIPASKGKVIAKMNCFFTWSPDGQFIIDRLPNHRRVTIACGFSSHGFKFMPVIGEILADLAIDGKTNYDIDFLSAKRFQSSKNTGVPPSKARFAKL